VIRGDEQGRLVRYFIEGPIDPQIARLYFDEFHNRREAEVMPAFDSLKRSPGGVRSADELDHEGFFRSDLYNEIWRPQGLRTRLEAVLRSARGRLMGSLVLYRGPGERRFAREDEARLAAVLPAFAAALQAAGGHLVSMLLLRLRERAAQQATEDGRARVALAPPPSIVHETTAGQFVARGELLRAAEAGRAPLAQVTLTRLESHRVALERALRALPITPGQIAVCRGLYQGLTQTEVGLRLGVAPATVVDHLRKVYRALDIGSGAELRHIIDARIGSA
jgi:DNA-binding CsgD family transcriptional regulator